MENSQYTKIETAYFNTMGLRAGTLLLLVKAAIVALFGLVAFLSSGITMGFIVICGFVTFLVILALIYELCARCIDRREPEGADGGQMC